MAKIIPIDLIEANTRTQSRTSLNDERIDDYAELLRQVEPSVWPFSAVCIVYEDDAGRYWLADGWHRKAACERANRSSVHAEIRQGDQRAAFLFACTANDAQGLPLTRADKRYCVRRLLEDDEWRRLKLDELATLAGCHRSLVSEVKAELGLTNPKASAAQKTRGDRQHPPENVVKRQSEDGQATGAANFHQNRIDDGETSAIENTDERQEPPQQDASGSGRQPPKATPPKTAEVSGVSDKTLRKLIELWPSLDKAMRAGLLMAAESTAKLTPELAEDEDFCEAWSRFVVHRSQMAETNKRIPCTQQSLVQNVRICAKLGPRNAVDQIEASISNGWRGIFERSQQAATRQSEEEARRERKRRDMVCD